MRRKYSWLPVPMAKKDFDDDDDDDSADDDENDGTELNDDAGDHETGRRGASGGAGARKPEANGRRRCEALVSPARTGCCQLRASSKLG